jgi:hypothetical protein
MTEHVVSRPSITRLVVDVLPQFFSSFTTLILSTNYVTKRQSLKLLGEILLDRANFNVMTRYIANEANLKMMMNLLRDKSKNIQFEAFHVFKVDIRLLFQWSYDRPFDPLIPLLRRYSLQTPRSHHRSKPFYGETRTSC